MDCSEEVFEAIVSEYKDDEEILKDSLMYLYKGCNFDDRMRKLRLKIVNWFCDNDYCIECGSRFETKETEMVHTELDGNPIEYLCELVCPVCDK